MNEDVFSVATRQGRDDAVIVGMRGDLDIASVPEVDAVLAEIAKPGSRIVLDLRELTFMDSTGVRTIVAAHQLAEESGCDLRVVRPPRDSPVARVIEISGIGEALGLVDAP